MFSDDVTLTDWDVSVIGKEDVLKANKNIFSSVDSINVKVKNVHKDGNKIKSIKAYKG